MRDAADIKGLRLLVAAALLAVVTLLVSLPLLAARVDAQSAHYETVVARSELDQAVRRLALRTEEGAVDDGVFQHADPRLDLAWFAGNMTSTHAADVESQIVYAFDSDGAAVFAYDHGAPVTGARRDAFARRLAPVVARMRVQERSSEALRRHPQVGRTPPVVSVGSTIVVGGRVFDVRGFLVASKSGTQAQARPHAPALLLVTDVATCLLPPLRERFGLQAARVVALSPSPGGDHGVVPLLDMDGRPAAYLVWTLRKPGLALLQQALVPILLVVCSLLGAVLFAYRRGTRSALALAASEARSYNLAFHDQLTDLANRRLLNARLEQALAGSAVDGAPVALLLVDLDHFKFVNDAYGHPAGDELIREVARRLLEAGDSDTLCARLGGDEFVILAPRCDAAAAEGLARRVLASLKAPVPLPEATVHTGGSIGVAVHPGGVGQASDLLRQADLALYRAKGAGRGGACFFEVEMDQALQHRRALEIDLRHALASDQLTVHYQPQFRDERLTGVEALARWSHPERGAVSPAVFIPLAEECGLIEELGWRVLRQAFADSARWPGLTVAVNVSPIQLRVPTFVPQLRALIQHTAIDPARFEIELTERVLMADDLQTQDTLATLRSLGFRLALDDFGTGYASLSYLRRFPIDKIKIDRSFVEDLPEDEVAEALIRAVVQLGRALGMEVIAEGVETTSQRRTLATNGCRSIQGFLVGRPSAWADIDVLVASQGDHAKVLS